MVSLTVAAAQIACAPSDVAANLDLHLRMIDEARSRGADLVVFPELSLTDYLIRPDVSALARRADDTEIRRIAEAARGFAVSFGFIERSDNGSIYNAQALARDGRVVAVHRKANLPTYGRLEEGRHYQRGHSVALARLDEHWAAATLICADIWNPALPWLAALQGADLLITPIASAITGDFDNPGGWDIALRHTAMTYSLPIVMVNHCGVRDGVAFWGGSRILDASGCELARAHGDEALIIATLEHAPIDAARQRLPTVRDADPELVLAELQRILTERPEG